MRTATSKRVTPRAAADRLVHTAIRTSAKAAHELGDVAGDALQDAAAFVRKAERRVAQGARRAPRDMIEYVRSHPVQALLWFGLGVAAIGAAGMVRRR